MKTFKVPYGTFPDVLMQELDEAELQQWARLNGLVPKANEVIDQAVQFGLLPFGFYTKCLIIKPTGLEYGFWKIPEDVDWDDICFQVEAAKTVQQGLRPTIADSFGFDVATGRDLDQLANNIGVPRLDDGLGWAETDDELRERIREQTSRAPY